MKIILRSILLFIISTFLGACATYNVQIKDKANIEKSTSQEVNHSFFIVSGVGNSDGVKDEKVLKVLESHLEKTPITSTLLFTGDNISEEGNDWSKDQKILDRQIVATKKFKGQTIFMPGTNEWRTFDTNKIERVENYIKEIENENISFYPKNVCPIEHQVINENLDLILIDSRWFISNWSRIKDINKKCTDIVTRRRFLEELEGYINDGQDKNIVIAMHHPIFSNGKYAGKDTFKSNMTPLPILGTIFNSVNELGAFSPDKLSSRRYNYLRILLSSYAQSSDRITVVSGHEESLQYLVGGKIHQIISGSVSRKTGTKRTKDRINTIGGSLKYEGIFSYGEKGFARLDYYKDGSSQVTFVSENEEEFHFPVLEKLKNEISFQETNLSIKKTKKDAVLDRKQSTDRTGFYRFMWGDRYRKYFGESVTAPVAMLDTLYGGLKVTKKGGGHQSYSIRLEDKNGKEYSMRSLRKNALKFLKFKIPGVAYTEDDYDDTFTENIISDFFTTAHPYMQLVVNPLARAVNVNHSSPSLFYVPKQKALRELNSEFGNELYFIEERPSDEQMNFKGYKRTIDEPGKINEFESTTDMLEKITSDESYTINQRDFIRARLFDMLLGDWDRHQDQWRWVEYEKKDGDKEFLPVPRDRDNAFPKFDGFAMKPIKWFLPTARMWQSYGPTIKSVKWLNASGNKLDRVLLNKFDTKTWIAEAKFIQQNLTASKVKQAFKNLPKEVQDQTSSNIEQNLLKRLSKLDHYAKAYSKYLNEIIVLHGTEKDDHVLITPLPNGKTKVVLKRLLSNKINEKMYERIFDARETKEIIIYGLGDDDIFEVHGDNRNQIKIRLIGGYGEDVYKISDKRNIKVYDWEHEKISFSGETPSNSLTNIYKTNTFHWRFFEPNTNIFTPNLGFRTDDGFFLGFKNTFTDKRFNEAKFNQKHSLAANYYFRFKAIEANYEGIFTSLIPKWNFEVNGYFTNDRFSTNFFGLGNNSINQEDQLGRNFYRSRMQMARLSAGVAYHTLRFKALYESFKVKENENRFFVPANVDAQSLLSQNYVGLETSAQYDLADAKDFPSKSILIGLKAGFKMNTSIDENKFGYLKFTTGFSHKLIPSGDLVLGTIGEVKTNFGNDYFFYHAPSIGGDNGLRGFRDERFSGKTYFYQTSDLRWRIKRYVTAIAPITIGAFGGFDYGRVWQPNEQSNIWHTSQGIGFWASGFNFLSANVGVFNSKEGNLIQFSFGFQF